MQKIMKNNLRKRRVWMGLTQEELSKELGIGISTLRRIEKFFYPKYQIRKKIYDFFGVNPKQIWKED